MSDFQNIVPSYLNKATPEEKKAFFQVLVCLSGIDGKTDDEELTYITKAASEQNITDFQEICNFKDDQEVIENVKVIQNRKLALELLREMCMLAHVDNILSDEETLFIGKIGLALGVEIEKIEQISNWIIDRIIWLEQAKIIFEED
jgi:hypothetical protein